MGDQADSSNNTCGGDEAAVDELHEAPNCNVTHGEPISIQCFPTALSPGTKNGFSICSKLEK